MDRTRIKICGITTPAAALAAADTGADAIGLVFAPGSPRLLDIPRARAIVAALPPFVTPVALFVNAKAEFIRQTAADLDIQVVQLHGQETPDAIADLAPLRVIKAIAFDPDQPVDSLAALKIVPNICAILWDSPPPPTAGGVTGGHGRTFDWDALARLKADGTLAGLPAMMLAGGLNQDNVADAIRLLHPWTVDVSSGVERERGVKDPAKIRDFCEAVRNA